jgi:hypothetical protein
MPPRGDYGTVYEGSQLSLEQVYTRDRDAPKHGLTHTVPDAAGRRSSRSEARWAALHLVTGAVGLDASIVPFGVDATPLQESFAD